MYFIGLGTAAPARRFLQREGWEALAASERLRELTPRSQAILRKVLLGDNGIAARHLSLERLSDAFELNPDALHTRFTKHAPSLAREAAADALRQAEISAQEIDAVIISTCTGYLCPGLTSYVSELLGLKPDVIALDLVGQGCGAAIPNFRMAKSLLHGGRCGKVLSICVEICSAAFYLDNDPGVLISACLFGDGAGAVVLSNEPCQQTGGRAVRWVDCGTILNPQDRDYLRFEQRGGMLRNILTPAVPAMAAKYADSVLGEVLARSNVHKQDIRAWIMHAGGREVLMALRGQLGLSEADLCWSAGVLREYGNVSSPCVIFALQSALRGGAGNGHWWMSAFGAGFSCHGALLEVN